MWNEKYRPKKLNEIVGQDEIIKSIQAMLPDIPHMIFYGKPGTGKTTTAKAIINELQCDSLELNASDERGIDTIRNKVKSFAKSKSLSYSEGMPRIKVILLEEADNLTKDSLDALRRIMEIYFDNCRFILTCNNIEKITPAIKSRCSGGLFEFKSFTGKSKEQAKARIYDILKKEGVSITDQAFNSMFNGDFRILDLLYRLSRENKTITKPISQNDFNELINAILKRKYTTACQIIQPNHVKQLFEYIMKSNFKGSKKAKLIKVIAEYDYRTQFAVSEEIQLCWLIGEIINLINQ